MSRNFSEQVGDKMIVRSIVLFLSMFCLSLTMDLSESYAKEELKAGPLVSASKPGQCFSLYQEEISDGSMDIRIIFGYKDARPARFVGDRHERLAFVQEILKNCGGKNQSCGFQRDPDDADLFYKSIRGPKGKEIQVRLFVVHSSVDSDDLFNQKNPHQSWQSQYAEDFFLQGLQISDVVFYNGHSRYGGGPDFESPVLATTGKIDISHYQKKKPGLKSLQKSIRQISKSKEPDGTRILGLFSCSSDRHFLRSIKSSLGPKKKIAVISNQITIHHSQASSDSLKALSDVLRLDCPDDLKWIQSQQAKK